MRDDNYPGGIDPEILPLVEGLNKGGIETVASCSGHGITLGYVWLKDGRALIVIPPAQDNEEMKKQIDKLIHTKQIRR